MAVAPQDFWPFLPMVGAWLLCGGLALALGRQRGRLATLDGERAALRAEIDDLRAAGDARRRAEAASEAKTRVITTVSHEIRTPLGGILGLADLLAGTALSREQQAYVDAMKSSGAALATLVDEVLDFARIDSGRLDLATEPFHLRGFVESIAELLAPQAQEKGLEIAAWVDDALPERVVGDAMRLRQVLLNLAGNAVKFTEAGGVGICVAPTSHGHVRFDVVDTGPGIPVERRATIFDEFEQMEGSATGGTGLGLAIARRIVAGMDGTLDLHGREGGGSDFAFTIPLPKEPGSAERPRPPGLAHSRVLIVSAAVFQPAFLAETLEGAGATVVRCRDDEAALEQLRYPFDLLLVDCSLGEFGARRLAKAAKAGGVARSLLLFSPFERRNFGQHLLGGFDAWLVKPVRESSLRERLVSPPAFHRTAAEPEFGPPPARPGTPARVLLAEDDPVNALIARTALMKLGADVVHVTDGAAALAEAEAALAGRQPRFDLIVMDVHMPRLHGLDATRFIRSAEARAGAAPTRIVALTAHAFEPAQRDCRAAGMNHVLTKPVAPGAFQALLSNRPPLTEAG